MDVYAIVGNTHTRKASVVRSLTGCFNRSLRDIELVPGGPALRVYARAGALQDARTPPDAFIAEASARRCEAVLVCLSPSANLLYPEELPDARAYLALFRDAGWLVKSIAVLGQNAGGLRSPDLRQFPYAPTVPINVTAAAVRAHFGWR